VQKLVKMNETAVERDKLEGTPHFLINGEPVPAPAPGSSPWQGLEPKLREAIG